jgi:site-specific DNA recombinase
MTNPNDKMAGAEGNVPRCGLYLRVSTGPQVEGCSLKTQKRQLLLYASARGYQVHDLYADAGLSAKDMKRPELQRLLADVEKGCIDIVLVWTVDRISRSMRDLLSLIEMFREHGVAFAAVEQQFDTSDPVGLLTLNILGSFAQFEREILVERTKEGHLRRLHRGDWSCGPVPFGYRKVDGKLVEVPEEAEVVRRIFRLFLKLRTMKGVARRLNEEGVRTRQGKLWSDNQVKYILTNPVYAGANVYGRHKKGDTRLKKWSQWTVVRGMREPLVESDVSKEVQQALCRSRSGAALLGPVFGVDRHCQDR